MTIFIKTKFKKSDDQSNIDNYMVATNIIEYHIILCCAVLCFYECCHSCFMYHIRGVYFPIKFNFAITTLLPSSFFHWPLKTTYTEMKISSLKPFLLSFLLLNGCFIPNTQIFFEIITLSVFLVDLVYTHFVTISIIISN